ncbi:hypothetical protein P9A16_32640 [Shinella sp. 838]|uniref:hypothetical protein n=1 Tax=Shinella sp. 838 TaxID=3038164 RepID=UPI0024151BA7|nr:hypothetical protein [Shinella sp. 838]MDG4675850.1 hypothetical protein [Shinella sp. 838]
MSDLVPADIFERLPERYRRRAREIAARVNEIDVLLRRCDTDALRDAAVRLRGQLRPQPDVEMADFAREFKTACGDLPEWAVSEATNDFLAGRVENHTGQFMPTCAEFARHARSIIAPFIGERSGLRNEAERLFERAEDEARRAAIAVERMDPGVRSRVQALVAKARAGAPVARAERPHLSMSEETRAKMDRLRQRRPETSKLAETRLVKGKRT